MANVNSRRCGCGQTFALPSLMSREQYCASCARAKAMQAMEARRQETSRVYDPATEYAARLYVKGGKGDPALSDPCAEGVAKPASRLREMYDRGDAASAEAKRRLEAFWAEAAQAMARIKKSIDAADALCGFMSRCAEPSGRAKPVADNLRASAESHRVVSEWIGLNWHTISRDGNATIRRTIAQRASDEADPDVVDGVRWPAPQGKESYGEVRVGYYMLRAWCPPRNDGECYWDARCECGSERCPNEFERAPSIRAARQAATRWALAHEAKRG
jgi:hypothetical protein